MKLDSITIHIEFDREEDGRWIAEIPALPGVLAYGDSREAARNAAQALALRVFADRLEHGEPLVSGRPEQGFKSLSFA